MNRAAMVNGADTRPGTSFLDHSTYRIRFAGAIDEEWLRRSAKMAVTVHSAPGQGSFTELVGELQDPAALMGVLDLLYNHGARLLSVECIEKDPGATRARGRVRRSRPA